MTTPVIYTFTGKRLNPLAFTEAEVCIEDIAHALALCNRFAGHTREPISVAQHSVYAACLVPQQFKLQALLHDASESYLGDMTHWLKQSPALAGFRDAEDALQRLIYRRYGVPEEDHISVKYVDRLLVRYEGLRGFGEHWHVLGVRPEGKEVQSDYPDLTSEEIYSVDQLYGGWQFWPWREAEKQFLRMFDVLYNGG